MKDKFGSETYKATCKKNKIKSSVPGIIGVLKDKQYEIEAFEVDHGETKKGYSFYTWRFYVKEVGNEKPTQTNP
jgi:hypothetical protein